MSIQLHHKHGVNPMLINCYYCGEASGVALLGVPKKAVKDALAAAGAPVDTSGAAPRQGVVMDKVPCNKCLEHMEAGIIVISVDDEKSDDMQNPWRTGGWCVMSEDWLRRVVTPDELAADILKKRVAFIPDEAWDMLNLPRGAE